MRYDFVALGDITTDCFIKLKDAEVLMDHDVRELCVRFGDKIPYESAMEVLAVGNSTNAAVAVARLGLPSAFVAHVGDDRNGEECLKALKERGVATEYVQVNKGMKTNYHYVLQYGAERTILIKHELYPYKLPDFPEPPAWFYLSSVPAQSLDYQLAIADFAAAHGVKLAFQPGTFQLELGKEKLARVYAASEIFFCNKEESQQILGTQDGDMKRLLSGIRSLGPKIAVITDGRNGAYIQTQNGAWSVPMYPDPAPPVSRTGAGDATASTTVAYIAKGMEPQEALLRGMINAAAGVQAVHVQLGTLTADKIEEWYAKRPANFVATKI